MLLYLASSLALLRLASSLATVVSEAVSETKIRILAI